MRSPRTVQQMHPLFISKISVLGFHDERVIDAHLPELVLNHGDALAVLRAQHVVHQRRLPGAQEPRDDLQAGGERWDGARQGGRPPRWAR